MTDIVRLALFTLSLDLILGYAGIVSLGHAAFFGVGAYSAGLLALHGIINEPVIALVVAGLVAMVLGFLTSFLVIRGVDLTRLMVTLGIALLLEALAERFSNITGGTDGLQGIEMQPILGLFAFDMFGKTGFFYSLIVLFLLFLLARRIVNSPFGLSLRAIKNNPLRASAIGVPVNRRLIAIYTVAAFYAGIAGALFTQTTALASLDVFSFERSADLMLVLVIGGTGYLYGGLIGAVVFKMLQEVFSTITPQYWLFWIGLVLVVIVLVGRDAHASLGAVAAQPRDPADRRTQGRRGRSRKRCAMTIALETRGLEKSFGGLKVTRDLSLQVEQGARHALIGPNGAGKTTVINLLTGVLKPNGGRILLEGNDITDLPVHTRVLRGLSRTFQINQLYADLTPLETVGLAVSERLGRGGDWWRRMGTRDDVNEEIAETLARFHLLDVMNELHRDAALWQAAPARDRGRDRDQAARAAARRARRRRARKRAPRYSGGGRRAAARRHGAADRARHGPGVLVRRPHLGAGQRRHAGGGPAGRGGAGSAGQGGLSRRGRRCLIFSPSMPCAPATARRWCCPRCR